jgi:hypothetical protein
MPWDYIMALVLLYMECPWRGIEMAVNANICCSSVLASLHHCLLLSPYFATPAALVLG